MFWISSRHDELRILSDWVAVPPPRQLELCFVGDFEGGRQVVGVFFLQELLSSFVDSVYFLVGGEEDVPVRHGPEHLRQHFLFV